MFARSLSVLLALFSIAGAARADVRLPPERPPWAETPKPAPTPGEKQLPPTPPAADDSAAPQAPREADASCQRASAAPRRSVTGAGLGLLIAALGALQAGRARTGPRAALSGR